MLRKKVNDLLASGASYAQVVRAGAADNAELDKCDRVTIDSVRNHCGRHFPRAERRQSLACPRRSGYVRGAAYALMVCSTFTASSHREIAAAVLHPTSVLTPTGHH